jgi:hypothetical protein
MLKQSGFSFYVLGDFNFRDKYLSPLTFILNNLDLHQIVEKPTRMDKLLDLIVCSSVKEILSHDVLDPALLDHRMIFCEVNVKKPKPPKVTTSFRPYGSINKDSFQSSLSLSVSKSFPTVCDDLNIICDSILVNFDIHYIPYPYP